MFGVYCPIGFEHIVSLAGFDHTLFIVVLCAQHTFRTWHRALLLLTGFTLGHSLTLALTALQGPVLPAHWVELLIPFTILMASIGQVCWPRQLGAAPGFFMAAMFGLVHGCGFAGYFSMMLGTEQSILGPLLAFNLGLEAGQALVAGVFMAAVTLINAYRPIVPREQVLFVSGAGAGLALKLILDQML
jgi:hypothetical protein